MEIIFWVTKLVPTVSIVYKGRRLDLDRVFAGGTISTEIKIDDLLSL
jgi:hypothetical protein